MENVARQKRRYRTRVREYICYDNRTDEIVALGTKEQCAHMLGIKVSTFIVHKEAFKKRDIPFYRARNKYLDIFEYDEDGNIAPCSRKRKVQSV